MIVVFRDKSIKAADVRKALKEAEMAVKKITDYKKGQVQLRTRRDSEDIREAIEDGLGVEILEINADPVKIKA